MIEVELRSFITTDQYTRLLEYFLKQGDLLDHTRQVTYYLDHDVDTRIQISTNNGKVWQKLGKMHDSARIEHEVLMTKADAKIMLTIFRNLGFEYKVAWYRERRTFKINSVDVALDDTVGYGKIVELEILCDENQVESSNLALASMMRSLGIEPTDKRIFDEAFVDYLKNWRDRTAHLNSDWINDADLH